MSSPPAESESESSGNACFFYGTLMSFKVLSRVIYGSASPEFWQCKDLRVRPAILHDYCRHQVKYADYPGIVHESGKCVRGTYVTGLTAMDMRRLDNFEGNEYGRVVVKVQLLNEDETVAEGEPGVECSVYVYKYDQHLVDAEWDFELFVKEKMHSWIGDTKTNSDSDQLGDPQGGRWWQNGFPQDTPSGSELGEDLLP